MNWQSFKIMQGWTLLNYSWSLLLMLSLYMKVVVSRILRDEFLGIRHRLLIVSIDLKDGITAVLNFRIDQVLFDN
jgi:hypothetical protein